MLSYFALFLLFFVVIFLFYGIILLHDIPYEIACKRNHPHQDAIHVAGWVSLFTLHAIWPFLWIWAMLYDPERGWRGGVHAVKPRVEPEIPNSLIHRLESLQAEVTELRARVERGLSGPGEG
jgi:hypothetical protein